MQETDMAETSKYIHLEAINACYDKINKIEKRIQYFQSEIDCYVSQERKVPETLNNSVSEENAAIVKLRESIGVLKSYGKEVKANQTNEQ